MNMIISKQQNRVTYKFLTFLIVFSFFSMITVSAAPVCAQVAPNTVLNLPLPGSMVALTDEFEPVIIKGMTFYPQNPLEFDFIIHTGDVQITGDALKEESNKLIKYFLASLTVPEEEMWVNLSPYENDRIIPEAFGYTEMGRDLLAQDYLLKQLTASLIYPEKEIGEEFWDNVYDKAYKQYGSVNIPVNTFNKIWIVPKDAVVAEKGSDVYILNKHLKVMLEEDYVAMQHSMGIEEFGLDSIPQEEAEKISEVSLDVIREVLIPEIEKEVNTGRNFAPLRQIYNSMILATWFKKNLKESLLGQVYVDKNKVKGVDVEDKQIKQKIYNQYVEAFKKGVYNYVKEDYDPTTQRIIPRKYFSGGAVGLNSQRDYTELNFDDPAKTVMPRYRTLAEETNKVLLIAEENKELQRVHIGLLENVNNDDFAMAVQGTSQSPQLSTRIFAENKVISDLTNPPDQRQVSHLVHIDVNMLKWTNDVFGKNGTDAAFNKLKDYLAELAQNLGEGSISWQHGGDEFAIAVANNPGDLQQRLQQFKDAFESRVFVVGALSQTEGLDDELINIALTKNGAHVSRVGGEVLVVVDKPSADYANREYLEQFVSFVNSNENLDLALKENTWVDTPVINNQLSLSLSMGVVEIDQDISNASAMDGQNLYETALHVAETRKDLSKQKVKQTNTFGKTDIVYAQEVDITRPREQTPGRSITIDQGSDFVRSFQTLQAQASKALVSPSWAGGVYYGDSLDKAKTLIDQIEESNPARLDNTIVFQLGMSGYNDPNGWIRTFQQQAQELGIPDERIDTRDLKVLNDTQQLGYRAGDDAIGLLRYGTLTQVPFTNEFEVIVVRGPPAGPIALLVPKEADYTLNDAEVSSQLESMAQDIQNFFNQHSIVQADRLSVAWDRVPGRTASAGQGFWTRLGRSLNEVNMTRHVVEARPESGRASIEVDKYDSRINDLWQQTERRRAQIAVEARSKLKQQAIQRGVEIAPVYSEDYAMTTAFNKSLIDVFTRAVPEIRARTATELQMFPITIPHRNSLGGIVEDLRSRGVFEPDMYEYANLWTDIHDTAYRDAQIDFNDPEFERLLKQTWATIGEAAGLDQNKVTQASDQAYELLRNNADPARDFLGNLFINKILGHGTVGMALNAKELTDRGFSEKEALGVAMLTAAHHPGFPITMVEDTVIRNPGINKSLPSRPNSALLPILMIDMESEFRTLVMADYLDARLEAKPVSGIIQLRQIYDRGESPSIIAEVSRKLGVTQTELSDIFTFNRSRQTIETIAQRIGINQREVVDGLKARRQASANYLRMKVADYVADNLGLMDRANARMHALLGYGLDRITPANPGGFVVNPLTDRMESTGGEIIEKKYGLVATSNITSYRAMTLFQVFNRSIDNVKEERVAFEQAVEDMKIGLSPQGIALMDEMKQGIQYESDRLIDNAIKYQDNALRFVNTYLRGSDTISFSGHLRDLETDIAIVEDVVKSDNFKQSYSVEEQQAAAYLLRTLRTLNTTQTRNKVNQLRGAGTIRYDMELGAELPAQTSLSSQEVIDKWLVIGGTERQVEVVLDLMEENETLEKALRTLRESALEKQGDVITDKIAHLQRVADYTIEQAQRDGRNRREVLSDMRNHLNNYRLAASPETTNVGGINLNAALLDLQIKRDGQGIPLPSFQQPIGDMKIDGFLPVIIDIAPIQNIPFFISLNEEASQTGV